MKRMALLPRFITALPRAGALRWTVHLPLQKYFASSPQLHDSLLQPYFTCPTEIPERSTTGIWQETAATSTRQPLLSLQY